MMTVPIDAWNDVGKHFNRLSKLNCVIL